MACGKKSGLATETTAHLSFLKAHYIASPRPKRGITIMTRMKNAVLLLLLAMFPAAAGFGQNTIVINVDAEPRPISPYIYGINWVHAGEPLYESWNLGSRRLGGNRLSNYNWENNGSNSGADCDPSCKNENDTWLIYRFPQADQAVPGILPLRFHQDSRAMDAYSIVQLQAAGYVAADLNDQPRPVPPAPSSRWKEVRPAKGGPFSLVPDPNDPYVYMDEQVNMLVSTLGTATQGGINAYSIDNEPGLWISSHPRLRGLNYDGGADVSNADDNNVPAVKAAKATCTEVAEKGIATARAVKAVDPSAEVYGPEFWGFLGYYNLQNAVDWPTYAGTYENYADMYLDRMAQASAADGKRLLDVLSLHWYPQVSETPQDILQAPRSLWDPTYKENSWIANDVLNGPIALIPTLRAAIDRNYPGTKLAITEFRFGDANNGNTWYGGLALADALGIFGREGIYAANYHPVNLEQEAEGYVAAAYKLYRNYDGQNSTFGRESLPALENIEGLSVHAALTQGDVMHNVHVILINTNMEGEITGELQLEKIGSWQYDFGEGFLFDRSGPELREFGPGGNFEPTGFNKFFWTIPAGTAMHVVFHSAIINGVAGGDDPEAEDGSLAISPNPAGESATVRLHLAKGGEGVLEIFDGTGRRVADPVGRRFTSGLQTFDLDTGALPSGVYHCRVECAGQVVTGRMIVHR